MSKSPWLSVLIPTYNGNDYLRFALQSIEAQGKFDIECIAIDDGSTDATLSILRDYKNKLDIKILQKKRRGNWVINTNNALLLASGEYVCFLHQDDIWLSNRLKTMKKLTDEYPDAVLFLTPSYYLNTDGNLLGTWKCPLASYPEITKSETMIEKLLIQNFISIPAPVFKRSVSQKVDGMDEAAWYTADWDFWLKIARQGNTIYYPIPLSGFRIHPMSQTIMRSSYLTDFRHQLEYVFKKHFDDWEAAKTHKAKFYKIGMFSVDVNVTLAGLIHKKQFIVFKLFMDFLLLGPMGWSIYFNNSRIWERTTARLRAQLAMHPKKKTGK